MFKTIAIAATLMLAASPAAHAQSKGAQAAREKLLVDASWLAQHLKDPNLVVLQVGNAADFDAGHITGSRLVTLQTLSAPTEVTGLTLELPQPEALRTALQGLGISDNSRVVIVPTRDLQSASRVLFTLEAAGLGDKASVLDGGINAWKRAGQATTAEATPAKEGKLSALTMQPVRVADSAYVSANNRKAGVSVVDARATTFFTGAQAGGGGNQPKGHVAGAKSIPFSALTNADLTLKSEAELRAVFTAAGVKPDDEVVSYCHVGQQATAVMLAAQTLGMKTRVYDGSYEDWSKKSLPVEASAVAPAP